MIVGRSTDYTGPGKVKTRSEDWFIAAGAERDAARAEIERLRLPAEAWKALMAWQKAENSLGVTENEVFPLMLAYEEAAKAAGGW